MRCPPDDAASIRELLMVDPCCYVREADLALLFGSREDAIALIAKAYLAFDLVLTDCKEIMAPGKVWLERNS